MGTGFKSIILAFLVLASITAVNAQDTEIEIGEKNTLEERTYQVKDHGELDITDIGDGQVEVNGGPGSGGVLFGEERYAQVNVGGSELYLVNCEVSTSSFRGVVTEDGGDSIIEENCNTRYEWEIENKDTGETASNGEILQVSSGEEIGLEDSGGARKVTEYNGGAILESIRDVEAAEDKTIYPGYSKPVYFYQGTGFSASRDQGINFFICEVSDKEVSLVPYELNFNQFNEETYNSCLNDLRNRDTIRLDLQESRPLFTGLETTTLNVNYPEGNIQKQIDLNQRTVELDNNLYYLIKNPIHSTGIIGEPANIKLGDQLFLQGEFHRDGETRLIYRDIDNPDRQLDWQITGSGFYFIHGNLRTQVHHDGNTVDIYMEGSGPSDENSYTSSRIKADGETLFNFCEAEEDNYETVNGLQIFRTSSPPNFCNTKDFSIETRDADNDNYDLMRKYEDKNFELDNTERITIYRGGKYRIAGIGRLSPLTRINLEDINQGKAEIFMSDKEQGIFFDSESCGYRSGTVTAEEGDQIGITEPDVFLETESIDTEGTYNVEFNVLESEPDQLIEPELQPCENDSNQEENNNNEDSTDDGSSSKAGSDNNPVKESEYLPITTNQKTTMRTGEVYEFRDSSGFFMIEDISETGIDSNPYKINILRNSQTYDPGSGSLKSIVVGSKTDITFDETTYWFYNCQSDQEQAEVTVLEENLRLSTACEDSREKDQSEETEEENRLTVEPENPETGSEITMTVSTTEELARNGYKIGVKGPEEYSKSVEDETSSSLTFEPGTSGEFEAYLAPKSLVDGIPLLEDVIGEKSVISEEFTVNRSAKASSNTQWRSYCSREYGETIEDRRECLQNDIIPDYFEDEVGSTPSIAESVCVDIVSTAIGSKYTYEKDSRQCKPAN